MTNLPDKRPNNLQTQILDIVIALLFALLAITALLVVPAIIFLKMDPLYYVLLELYPESAKDKFSGITILRVLLAMGWLEMFRTASSYVFTTHLLVNSLGFILEYLSNPKSNLALNYVLKIHNQLVLSHSSLKAGWELTLTTAFATGFWLLVAWFTILIQYPNQFHTAIYTWSVAALIIAISGMFSGLKTVAEFNEMSKKIQWECKIKASLMHNACCKSRWLVSRRKCAMSMVKQTISVNAFVVNFGPYFSINMNFLKGYFFNLQDRIVDALLLI